MQNLWKKLTPWLDRKPSQVPVSKRIIAYAIDWAIGGIITGFPAVLIYAAVTKKSDMFSDLYIFASLGYPVYWGYIAGGLCLLVALIYYVYIPYKKYPGQTLGKKWMKIKIVKKDGQDVDLKTLLIRQVLGMMIIEGAAYIITNYIRQMLTLATGFYVEGYLSIFGATLTVISGVLFYTSASQRSLHDYLANTRVALETEVYVPEDVKKSKPRKKKHR